MREKTEIIDVLKFYLGFKEATIKVATTKHIFWVACLLVVSAALARNYDHHLLLSNPIWIGGPFFMAFFSSALIFSVLRVACRIPLRSEEQSFPGANFLAWIKCFFLTAPLAWLYGIPYESFVDILTATKLNFATLLLVSLWRVYIMGQVAHYLYKIHALKAYCVMLVPASLEMLFGSFYQNLNIVGIMGGLRLSEKDQLLANLTSFVTVTSFWVLVGSLFFAVLLMVIHSQKAQYFSKEVNRSPSRNMLIATVASIMVFLATAFYFQPKLSNVKTLRRLLVEDQYSSAVEFLNKNDEKSFPPGHEIFSYRHDDFTGKSHLYLHHREELQDWVVKRIKKDFQYNRESLLEDMSLSEEPSEEAEKGGREEFSDFLEKLKQSIQKSGGTVGSSFIDRSRGSYILPLGNSDDDLLVEHLFPGTALEKFLDSSIDDYSYAILPSGHGWDYEGYFITFEVKHYETLTYFFSHSGEYKLIRVF